MGVTALPAATYDPVQARRMSIADIGDLRRWHRQATERAIRAGFDIVYVYAGHGLTTIQHFLIAPLQRPHRRLRRQHREPGAAAA